MYALLVYMYLRMIVYTDLRMTLVSAPTNLSLLFILNLRWWSCVYHLPLIILYISYILFITYPCIMLWNALFIHIVLGMYQIYPYDTLGNIHGWNATIGFNKYVFVRLRIHIHPINKAHLLIILSGLVPGSSINNIHSTYGNGGLLWNVWSRS